MRLLPFAFIIFIFLLAVVAPRAASRPSAEDSEKRIIEAERTSDFRVFDELLSRDSVTIGPDGRRHSKSEMLQILHSIPPQNVLASEFVTLPVGKDAAIVNYVVTSTLPDGRTRQHTATSIWMRSGARWSMLFHQGTEIPQ